MIRELVIQKLTIAGKEYEYPDTTALVGKINELVDAVNELEKTAETRKFSKMEQRRWLGKICRFWYDNPNDTLLDYLDKIQTGKNGVEYYSKESGDWFPHCEPVLPTDNAIYKGGNNE